MITKSSVLAIAQEDIAKIVKFANKRYNKHFTLSSHDDLFIVCYVWSFGI